MVRPGPASGSQERAARAGGVDERERWVGKLVEQLRVVVGGEIGPGRLNAPCRPSKLPWPMSSTNTSSLALARAGDVGERLGDVLVVERPRMPPASIGVLAEIGDVGVGTPCFFAASTTPVAHLWNCFDVLFVAADAGDDEQVGVLRRGRRRDRQAEQRAAR